MAPVSRRAPRSVRHEPSPVGRTVAPGAAAPEGTSASSGRFHGEWVDRFATIAEHIRPTTGRHDQDDPPLDLSEDTLVQGLPG